MAPTDTVTDAALTGFIPDQGPDQASPDAWHPDRFLRRWHIFHPTSDKNRLCDSGHCRKGEMILHLQPQVPMPFYRLDMSSA